MNHSLTQNDPNITLTKLVALRDGIDSLIADRPSQRVEDNLYWSRQLIVAAIREAAAKLSTEVAA